MLIDRLAGDGPRDQAFVRAFSSWLHARAQHFRLEPVAALGLTDVVVTFQMRDRVRLVVTGYLPDHPGELTWTVDERDFPFVGVTHHPSPAGAPYTLCTLDYALAGRRVLIPETPGAEGTLVVSATIADQVEHRVRLDTGAVVTISGDRLDLK